MPEGVISEVVDGFATIDFVDGSLKGAALARLMDIGGPASIQTITREGPRRKYRVPEGNAAQAGPPRTADKRQHLRRANPEGTGVGWGAYRHHKPCGSARAGETRPGQAQENHRPGAAAKHLKSVTRGDTGRPGCTGGRYRRGVTGNWLQCLPGVTNRDGD